MATSIICDFCGGKVEGRGSGVLKITSSRVDGQAWDHCEKCRRPLTEAISNLDFRPEQPPLGLEEYKERTVSAIQAEIDVLRDLRETVLGKSRPVIMKRMLDALDKELDQARARAQPLGVIMSDSTVTWPREGGQTAQQATNNLSEAEPKSQHELDNPRSHHDWPYQPHTV